MNETKMLGKRRRKLKYGQFPDIRLNFLIYPDGNLTLENEGMSGKMRTYGNPKSDSTGLRKRS
jgi:hypothetical protein